MNTVYAVSRWSNAFRPRTRHLDNGQGLPACGAQPNAFSWERSEDAVTCTKCQRQAQPAGWSETTRTATDRQDSGVMILMDGQAIPVERLSGEVRGERFFPAWKGYQGEGFPVMRIGAAK